MASRCPDKSDSPSGFRSSARCRYREDEPPSEPCAWSAPAREPGPRVRERRARCPWAHIGVGAGPVDDLPPERTPTASARNDRATAARARPRFSIDQRAEEKALPPLPRIGGQEGDDRSERLTPRRHAAQIALGDAQRRLDKGPALKEELRAGRQTVGVHGDLDLTVGAAPQLLVQVAPPPILAVARPPAIGEAIGSSDQQALPRRDDEYPGETVYPPSNPRHHLEPVPYSFLDGDQSRDVALGWGRLWSVAVKGLEPRNAGGVGRQRAVPGSEEAPVFGRQATASLNRRRDDQGEDDRRCNRRRQEAWRSGTNVRAAMPLGDLAPAGIRSPLPAGWLNVPAHTSFPWSEPRPPLPCPAWWTHHGYEVSSPITRFSPPKHTMRPSCSSHPSAGPKSNSGAMPAGSGPCPAPAAA